MRKFQQFYKITWTGSDLLFPALVSTVPFWASDVYTSHSKKSRTLKKKSQYLFAHVSSSIQKAHSISGLENFYRSFNSQFKCLPCFPLWGGRQDSPLQMRTGGSERPGRGCCSLGRHPLLRIRAPPLELKVTNSGPPGRPSCRSLSVRLRPGGRGEGWRPLLIVSSLGSSTTLRSASGYFCLYAAPLTLP